MFSAESDSVDFLLVQIIRLFQQRSHCLFGRIGIYPGQPPVLFRLWKQDGRTQKELAEKLLLKPATLTLILQRMERDGLVERRPDPADQRISRVYLTEKGKKLREPVEKAIKEREREILQGFTAEEKLLLRRFLIRVRDNLAKGCGTAGCFCKPAL
ncbi:MAG TPA: MarR family transcriptional regulator [Syntrophomonadaceae bacterium]|nr:MarR family transcriptional regulator [Syntrophomonadaceae bacterium]